MRKSFILLLFSLLVIRMSAQRYDIELNGCYFNSIFSKVGSGNFKGTINGVLFMKNYQGGDVILDFQGGKANLNIEEDKDEIYDVSWKKYQGYTTSELSIIQYSTYAMANRLIITMPSGSFAVGVIDGACDSIIKGLSYYYKEEKNTEYLILRVEKEIKMASSDNENKTISIQPESVIIFAIDRRN